VAITFPDDGIVFAFFGAGSPSEVHCFDCSLVSGLYQWIHVSSTVTKRRRNSFGLRLNSVRSEQTRHPSRRQLSHAENFMQDMTQFLTIAIEGEESPYTACKSSLISLRDFPSKNKNGITDRYCSFSIFLKSADTSDSTRSRNKTTSPIRLEFGQLPSTRMYYSIVHFSCDSDAIGR